MEKDKEFKQIKYDIMNQLYDANYTGDLSDIGNEIGTAIAKYISKNKMGFELDSFINGVKHGISLENGTHDDPEFYNRPKEMPAFWFMTDSHQFIKPSGNNLKEIKKDFLRIAKENTYGAVCPVGILLGDKEIRRVGTMAHVDKNGNVDLSKWEKEIVKDKVIFEWNKLTK